MDPSHILNKLYGQQSIPKCLNNITFQQYIKVHQDHLTAEFIGRGNNTDPGSVKSDIFAPNDCILYYFEVEILECSTNCKIVVGFTPPYYHLNKVPGIEQGSIGYKAEDGMKLCGSMRSESFGPTYTKGDVIGAGLNYISKSYFFTKNGTFIGTAGTIGQSENYPTVGLNTNDKVKLNFTGPFQYDILSLYNNEIENNRKAMEAYPIPKEQLESIVRTYLIYKGYTETLNVFNNETKYEETTEVDENSTQYIQDFYHSDEDMNIQLTSMPFRNQISLAILSGNVLEALDLINKNYPNILSNLSKTALLLYSQHAIELIKKGEVEKAIEWSQEYLFPFLSNEVAPETKEILKLSCGLFAYEDIQKCSLSYEISHSRRMYTCNLVNEAILESLGIKKKSGLCTLVQSLNILHNIYREQNGNKGPAFTLEKFKDTFLI